MGNEVTVDRIIMRNDTQSQPELSVLLFAREGFHCQRQLGQAEQRHISVPPACTG